MAQNRTHDYRGPRSSEQLNRHLVDLMPSGVYKGFHVAKDGTLSAGVLLTPEGIRIEETSSQQLDVPPGHATLYRRDIVVCRHEYQKTVPAPAATFEIIEGTPAPFVFPSSIPELPEVPEHAMLLASCWMYPTATEWETVDGPPFLERMINCEKHEDGTHRIIHGDRAAFWFVVEANTGLVLLYIWPANDLDDNDPIAWTLAALTLDSEGIPAVRALETDKMDKAGGTFDGPVVFDDTATFNDAALFNHEDPTAVAFDDWVTFTRHILPFQANSEHWLNKGWYWQSISDVTGKVLLVPIPAYVGTELVSVDVGIRNNDGAVDYNMIVGFSKFTFGSLLASMVDFGDTVVPVTHSTEITANIVLVDPSPPNAAEPWVFNNTEMLLLRLKTGAEDMWFTGAKANYRRKQLAI